MASDVKRYMPALNGTAFMGMWTLKPYAEWGPPEGPYVLATDLEAAERERDEALALARDFQEQARKAGDAVDEMRAKFARLVAVCEEKQEQAQKIVRAGGDIGVSAAEARTWAVLAAQLGLAIEDAKK